STGAVIVTFAWPTSLGAQPARETSAAGVDAWLAVATDGAVTLFTGKVEIGTGVSTALAQIVAEELDVRVERVGVIQGDTERTPNEGLHGRQQDDPAGRPTDPPGGGRGSAHTTRSRSCAARCDARAAHRRRWRRRAPRRRGSARDVRRADRRAALRTCRERTGNHQAAQRVPRRGHLRRA